MNDIYKFAVSCRNVTLGIFDSMADAKDSIDMSVRDGVTPVMETEWYAEYAAPHHLYTIVGVRPSTKPAKLHKD